MSPPRRIQRNESSTILVIDVGLTNCRAICLGPTGEALASASIPHTTTAPRAGWAEQDPAAWWAGVCATVRRSYAAASRPPLAAISVTGQMHALVCIGNDGTSLFPAMVLGDERATQEASEIQAQFGGQAAIYKVTGTRMDASMPVAKLRWLRRHRPTDLDSAVIVLSCKDYIRRRMTGDAVTDPLDACATSLYELGTGAWSPRLVDFAGIRTDQLPRITSSDAIAGPLGPRAAADLGVPAGVPVVVGAGDDVETLGAGLVRPGVALEHFGTTGSIFVCASSPVTDLELSLESYPHVVPGRWVVGGSTTTAGAAIEWASRILGYGSVAGALDEVAAGPEESSDGAVFLPYLAGERAPSWRSGARGAWTGLSLNLTRGDLVRAVVDGVAFSMRSILERADELLGVHSEVLVAGRDAANPRWLERRAAIYGRPVRVLNTPDPTTLGAMILAAVALGRHPSLLAAAEMLVTTRELIEPDPRAVKAFADRYERFGQVKANLETAVPPAPVPV